jgi:hypothetical protein
VITFWQWWQVKGVSNAYSANSNAGFSGAFSLMGLSP